MFAKHASHSLLLTTLTLTLIQGCAKTPNKQQLEDSFRTRISSEGLKHFELRFFVQSTEQAQQNNNSHAQNRPSPPQHSRRQFKKSRSHMTNLAEHIVDKKGFCAKGFWVIDFDKDLRGYYLRGECNDIASISDRDNFPDTLMYW